VSAESYTYDETASLDEHDGVGTVTKRTYDATRRLTEKSTTDRTLISSVTNTYDENATC